ncbi:MAG: C40 family peptidase [Rhodothermales bacterium]
MELALREAADTWAGTPHVWGGTSREGIDCSALVQTVYKDLLSVNIPRTTALQSKVGAFVPLNNMQVGDLVFYRINRRTRHVGIYVGENEFMHASKSNGVTISALDDEYWQNRFWMVRRIFELPEEELAGEENSTVPNKNRSGW